MKNSGFLQLSLIGIVMIIALSACNKNEYAKPERRDITEAVFANGFISTSDEYLVTAKAEGFIDQSFFKEGDKVRKGDELFKLSNPIELTQLANAEQNYIDAKAKASTNSPELAQLKLQIEQAKNQVNLDENTYNRYKALIATKAVSQMEYEQAEIRFKASKSNLEILESSLAEFQNALQLNVANAKAQLEIQKQTSKEASVQAFIDGYIEKIFKKQGELVRRGEVIAKVGGCETILKLFVAEDDIKSVQNGQQMTVALNTEERTYTAVVSKIYPSFDESEQSFVIEATFLEVPALVLSGTQVQANIVVEEKKDALIIPSSYLVDGNKVMLENGLKEVEIGIRNYAWVEIIEGLDENDELIKTKE